MYFFILYKWIKENFIKEALLRDELCPLAGSCVQVLIPSASECHLI